MILNRFRVRILHIKSFQFQEKGLIRRLMIDMRIIRIKIDKNQANFWILNNFLKV